MTSSRSPLVIGILAGVACLGALFVLVLAVVIGGILFWNPSGPEPEPNGTSGNSGTSETEENEENASSPGFDADQPYLKVGTSDDGPVVDVYIDFLCPHCAAFHDVQGEDLQQMAQDGEITLRIHPRSMLDAESTPEGYSGRAANAAVCAYVEDPAQWFAVESALFTDQPDAAGLSDEELSTRITDATGLDVGDCIADGTYLSWVEDVVEPEAQSTGQGTPAVFIDGEQFTGDVSAPGSLEETVAAA